MEEPRPRPPEAKRSRRRSSQEVRALILDAARTEFALNGFEGATTRAIAQRAGVLESLIFGNFGSKGALFGQAIMEPINAAFSEGVFASEIHPIEQSETRMLEFIKPVYAAYRKNSDLFDAMVKSSNHKSQQFGELMEEYFTKSEERLRAALGGKGSVIDIEPGLSVRLLYGMLISTILLRGWMFPHGEPDEDKVVIALAKIMSKAVSSSA